MKGKRKTFLLFVGSVLPLLLVALGSVWIWERFGGASQGVIARRTEGPTKQSLSPELALPTFSGLPRNDGGALLATYGAAPEFSLTERSGRILSTGDLAGKPWIANFIFTSCAGQCPLMSLQMRRLQKEFPRKTGLQLVSLTVDPRRDSPEILSQYADRYEAEKDRWFFLTGPQKEINRILKEFFLSPAEEPAMHSIRFISVDGAGQIRGYYDSSDAGAMKRLIRDVRMLLESLSLREGPEGRRSNSRAEIASATPWSAAPQ